MVIPRDGLFYPTLTRIMDSFFLLTTVFSSPEQKAQGELIVWDSSRRLSVRPSTLSNMNISETSWPIIIKFHQEHHKGGGLTALGLGKIGSELWFPWQQIAPIGL